LLPLQSSKHSGYMCVQAYVSTLKSILCLQHISDLDTEPFYYLLLGTFACALIQILPERLCSALSVCQSKFKCC